jgi:hypothetical protein
VPVIVAGAPVYVARLPNVRVCEDCSNLTTDELRRFLEIEELEKTEDFLNDMAHA